MKAGQVGRREHPVLQPGVFCPLAVSQVCEVRRRAPRGSLGDPGEMCVRVCVEERQGEKQRDSTEKDKDG